MHILLLSEFFADLNKPVFTGGVEVRCFYLAKELAKKHAITVLARKKHGEKSFEKQNNLTIYRFGKSVNDPKFSLRSTFDRLSYVIWSINKGKEINVDIIEGSNFTTFQAAAILAKLKKIPAVAFYPDILIGKWIQYFGFIKGIIGELIERLSLRFPWQKIIIINPELKEPLMSFGVKVETIEYIPCGIDHDLCQQIRKKIEKQEQLIVVSRLVAYKRIDWVIKNFAQLKIKKNYPELKLIIIGQGPEANKIVVLINKLHLQSEVIIKQNLPVTDLYQEIAKSILLLHPSIIEGFGIVLVEAGALGTPVVAADIQTSKHLHKTINNICLFERSSQEDFYNRTADILNNKEIYKVLQINGIANSKKFDWSKIAEDTLIIYQRCLIKH